MTPSTGRPTKWAGFLDLPAELRNHIYHLRFASNSFFTVKSYKIRYHILLPLLLANTKIAEEARPVLFAQNGIHLVPHRIDPFSNESWRLTELPRPRSAH